MSGLLSTVSCKKEDYDKESIQTILPQREVMCHDFFHFLSPKQKSDLSKHSLEFSETEVFFQRRGFRYFAWILNRTLSKLVELVAGATSKQALVLSLNESRPTKTKRLIAGKQGVVSFLLYERAQTAILSLLFFSRELVRNGVRTARSENIRLEAAVLL